MNARQRQLVADNLGYVHTLAAGFTGRGVDYDDLVQAGSLLLCELAHEYNPKAHPGVSFGQYARLYLIRAFGREIRAAGTVPAACRRSVLPLSAAREIAAPDDPPEGRDFWRVYPAVLKDLKALERRILAGWFGLASRRGPGSQPATIRALSIRHGVSRRTVKLIVDQGLTMIAGRLDPPISAQHAG